jgi:hypothetical protein
MNTISVRKTAEISKLIAKVKPRYWEDTTVNGEDDVLGGQMPCAKDGLWCPEIDIETGVVTNWKQGTVAAVHYKVCDNGEYPLFDKENNLIKTVKGYVPKIMCPKESGYGDYIIMDIDENGKINDWDIDLSEFND